MRPTPRIPETTYERVSASTLVDNDAVLGKRLRLPAHGGTLTSVTPFTGPDGDPWVNVGLFSTIRGACSHAFPQEAHVELSATGSCVPCKHLRKGDIVTNAPGHDGHREVDSVVESAARGVLVVTFADSVRLAYPALTCFIVANR